VLGALVLAGSLTATAAGASSGGAPRAAESSAAHAVIDGAARFEVITPRLIRVEYALGGAWEDRPTFNVINRDIAPPPFTVTNEFGILTIKTSQLTLHYVDDSGPFTPVNLSIDVGVDGATTTAHPVWGVGVPPRTTSPHNLGGWYRELAFLGLNNYSTQVGGAVDKMPLNDGLLSSDGWYLLDDSDTAILQADGQAVPRPAHLGPYQDGYFFGYGHDYEAGLRDLKTLTGPPVMLPEWAFGVWFSDYAPISTADYEQKIIPTFRSEGVPIDGLVVDTNWKAPDDWNGWSWNTTLFPHPAAFLSWARSQGLNVTLNIHPSIDVTDPHFAATQAAAGGTLKTSSGDCAFYRSSPPCYVFDWGQPAQAKAYFALHAPFQAQGVRQWWLDWCCDASTVSTPGLTADSWINHLYASDEDAEGYRGFALSRIGSTLTKANGISPFYAVPVGGPWAEHRSTVHFTGDAPSTWNTLAYEAGFTQQEANIDMAYVTDDIGGYSGKHLADDLYVRWVQFGTFQPILRLHSDNGDRLPWEYDGPAREAADKFLRLREALVPYLYTTGREAYDTGIAMVRAMQLEYPDDPAAVAATHEYMLGDNLLVAPVTTPGNMAATPVWLPPGSWTDLFTGVTYHGPSTQTITSDFDTMPVFVRGGGIIPEQEPVSHVEPGYAGPLILEVAPGANGSSTLYADSGEGHSYEQGDYTFTPLRYRDRGLTGAGGQVEIDPPAGHGSKLRTRGYEVEFLGVDHPGPVGIDGHGLGAGDSSSFDAATHTLTVVVAPRSTSTPVVVSWG